MTKVNTAIRKERERNFHNERYGGEKDIREPLNRWYAALAACGRTQNEMVRRYSKNGMVLEYGCADGYISLVYDHLSEGTDSFVGIDISNQAIELAQNLAIAQGLNQCEFTVMDAENMTFPDNSFDVVFGRGILHHLDLSKCFPEIARVLRPDGKAIFTEPLGHNPALNLFRQITPQLRTPDEHPLLMSDLRFVRTEFSKVECKFFGLTTLLAVPFQKTPIGSTLMTLCERVDKILLSLPLRVVQFPYF